MVSLRRDGSDRGRQITRLSSWKAQPAQPAQPAHAADSPSTSSRRAQSSGKTNPDRPRPQPSRTASSSTARTRVLIIEDDHTHASALRSILTRKGCDVIAAVTLDQGMAMLDPRPDYIVLDLMLPDGDGVEVLRRLRQTPGADTPRVIVTTAVSDPARIREVLDLQPHRLLRKPIDLVDLLSAIRMM